MLNKQLKVYLGLRTSLIFLFFFTTVFLGPTLFTSLSSLFRVTREQNRFLQR